MSLAALCTQRVTIQRNEAVADGAGGMPENWVVKYVDAPAHIRTPNVNERDQWAGRPTTATHVMYVTDATLDIRENDQVKWNGRTLNIVGVDNPHQLGHHLRIELWEVKQ